VRGPALGLIVAIAAGCAGLRAAEEDRAYQAGLAAVARISVQEHRERPVMVSVTAWGELPDPCTRLDRVRQERRGSGIDVTLTTRREAGAECAAAPQPFVKSFQLMIDGLAPGLYAVTVNGVPGSFQIFRTPGTPDRFERDRIW
jgi:inhibitor of cysteine peptidase